MGTSSYAGETNGCGPAWEGDSSEENELEDLSDVWDHEALLFIGDEPCLDDLLNRPMGRGDIGLLGGVTGGTYVFGWFECPGNMRPLKKPCSGC